jgi:uncharacterized protein YacL
MFRSLLSYFASHCDETPNFFNFPTWYKYIDLRHDPITGRCEVPSNFQIEDFSLIGLAMVDIAFRVAALVAVAFVIYGGIQFVTAQGEADKVKKARQTIINAIIGLVIALLAAGLVAFIGERIGS